MSLKDKLTDDALDEISRHASNGREAVNIVQLAAGIAQVEMMPTISWGVVQKVINTK